MSSKAMTKSPTSSNPSTPDNSARGGDKKKKVPYTLFSEAQDFKPIKLSRRSIDRKYRGIGMEAWIYVATWNVGGRTPDASWNLEDFLQVDETPDLYICGFQEIVPLSAGNVLVIEDSEPATKWLALISQTINRTTNCNIVPPGSPVSGQLSSNAQNKDAKSHNFFNKQSVKVLTKNLRVDASLLKICNCASDLPTRDRQQRGREFSGPLTNRGMGSQDFGLDDECPPNEPAPSPGSNTNQMVYSLDFFMWDWDHGLPRQQGEKEGDELKRNADVSEILRSIQFPKICKNQINRAPEKITGHDRVFWFGDLNYRISLSYEETKVLLEENDWDTLLDRDQLNMEREAGRVFDDFCEGRILFAPTYKYSLNSDLYAGETVKNKKKRRTPAWCDRVLWRGEGVEQMSYIRVEYRYSDHRPVCAIFSVEVEMSATRSNNNRFRKGYSCTAPRVRYDNDCSNPQRHNFYGY
ncbi:unnamed protein product [Linum tenue]|uniref:Inositol polyphosphate-related phosphatase domain-containing protein n=1 Tax=Linum tenue TaxID=586396 RepID=A0AAV0KEP5_9ROSI|nr:unnamed protein product [Linum tenue]